MGILRHHGLDPAPRSSRVLFSAPLPQTLRCVAPQTQLQKSPEQLEREGSRDPCDRGDVPFPLPCPSAPPPKRGKAACARRRQATRKQAYEVKQDESEKKKRQQKAKRMNSTLAAAPALGVWPPMGTTATSGSSSRSGSNGSSSSSSVLQDSGTDTPALSFSLSDTPRSSHHFALFTPTLAPSTASSSKHSSTQQLHFASPSQEQQLYFHQQQQQQQPRLHIPGLKSGAQLTPASLSAVAPPLSPGATSPSLEKLALFAQSKSLALKERSSELAATLSSTTVNAGALAAPTSATATTLGHKSHDSAAGTLRLASTERQGAAVGLQAGDASMTLDPPEPQVGAVGPSAASNGPSVPALSSSALHALGIDFPEPSQQAPPPYTKQQLQPLQQTHPTLFSAAPFQQRQAHASGASPKGHHHARSHSHHVQQQKPYDFGEGATHSPLTRAPQSPHTTDQQHLRSHPHAQGPKQQHQQNQQHQHKHVQQATTQVVVPPSKPERVCRGEDFGIRIGDFDLLDTLGPSFRLA